MELQVGDARPLVPFMALRFRCITRPLPLIFLEVGGTAVMKAGPFFFKIGKLNFHSFGLNSLCICDQATIKAVRPVFHGESAKRR